jgi:hypothetical protein
MLNVAYHYLDIVPKVKGAEIASRPCVTLFFIELGSRRVHLAGCTPTPSAPWVTQRSTGRTSTRRTRLGDDRSGRIRLVVLSNFTATTMSTISRDLTKIVLARPPATAVAVVHRAARTAAPRDTRDR